MPRPATTMVLAGVAAAALAVAALVAFAGGSGEDREGPQTVPFTALQPSLRAGRVSATGRVVDALAQPVAGCEVAAQRRRVGPPWGVRTDGEVQRTRTAADGSYRLLLEPAQPMVLVLTHRDFPAARREVYAPAEGGSVELGNTVLESTPGLIVEVLDERRRRPVAAARVTLVPAVVAAAMPAVARQAAACSGITDGDGRVVLPGVRPGAYTLRVEAAGLAARELPHVQPADAVRPPTRVLTLDEGVVLAGRLTGPAGEPVGDASLTLTPVAGPAPGSEPALVVATAVADGSFRAAGLAAGRYLLSARSPLFGRLDAGEVQVPGPVLHLRFRSGGSIRGRLVSAAGQPLAGGTLRLVAEVGGELWGTTAADGTGGFQFVGVSRGRFLLEATSHGHIRGRFGPLEPGSDPVILTLTVGRTIRGTVTAPGHATLPPTTVHIVPATFDAGPLDQWQLAADPGPSTTVGPDGRFELAGTDAAARLWIVAPGWAPHLTAPLPEGDADLDLPPITVAAGGTVRGIARLAGGEPAPFAQVSLVGTELGCPGATARADAAGRFEFRAVAAGGYRLTYDCPEQSAAARPVTVVDGGIEFVKLPSP